MKIFFPLVTVLALTSLSLARGQEIAINFDTDANGDIQDITGTTGVVPVAAADWNNINAPQADLDNPTYVDSNGTFVPNFSLYANAPNAFSTIPANTALGNLFNAYGDQIGTLSVTNVPYATYDVYVYVASNGDGRDATGTIGSETLSFSTAAANATSFTVNSTPDPDPANPTYGAYDTLLFQNVSGSSFTYTQAVVSQAVGIAGIEIVAVPEPSTWAMLLAGAAVMMGALRLRRQTL